MFLWKRNTNIQNDEHKFWELFPILRTHEQLSLSANKAHKFVYTVFGTVEIYAWTILFTGGIDSFKLKNQEGNKSANRAEE